MFMRYLNIVSCCTLILSAASLHPADKGKSVPMNQLIEEQDPLLENNEEAKRPPRRIVVQQKSPLKLYDLYIASQQWTFPYAHCFLQEEPQQQVAGELKIALELSHKDAVAFYAPYAGNIAPLLKQKIIDGHINQVELLLPALEYTTFETTFCPKDELPCSDVSGLAWTVECKDERIGLQIAKTIVNFYKPTRECRTVCCRPCPARCQERREAFLIYGASKALEAALKAKDEERKTSIINYFLNTCGAYVSREVISYAKDNKELARKLQAMRAERSTQENYALLSAFQCIQNTPGSKTDYMETLAYPIIRNKKPHPRSWVHPKALCPR